MRGQALLLESILIVAAVIATLILTSHLFKVQYIKGSYELRINAERILTYLADSGYIYPIAYGISGSGDPDYAKTLLDSMIPPNFGYNFTVASPVTGTIFSITRNFNPAAADGGQLILMRGEGRIVILLLSR